MRRLFNLALMVGVIAAIAAWILSAPKQLSSSEISSLSTGNAKQGETIFWAGGCASCHSVPKAKGDAKLVLAGGHEFKTPFGTFRSPNISSDKQQGIGSWSLEDFANAMIKGVSPDGSHYYPAFPYTSYAGMKLQDVADLWAYMKTLPASDKVVAEHDVGFPFNIRRGLGLWKLLYLDDEPVLKVASDNSELLRGRYLVETVGHCAACHTPRNLIGGPDKSRWLAGGESADGGERIPNITPHADGIGGWSVEDIIYSLESGFTPDFDSLGSTMTDVVENMSKLEASDRAAIAAYLKAVEAVGK